MMHREKISENKTQSTAANANRDNTTVQLKDNREISAIQQKLSEKTTTQKTYFTPIQKKANNTGLPDNLKLGIENLSGHAMDDVKVHYNSDKPAQLNAHAYAQGTDIHIASGQEKHLAHEAWHVVQQKQGRVKPTLQMKGKVNVNDDKGLEKEADIMGAKAVSLKTAPMQYHKPVSYLNSGTVNQNIVQGFWKELAVAAAVGAGALGGAYIGAALATAYTLSTVGTYGAVALGTLALGGATHKAIDLVEDMRPQIHIKRPPEKNRDISYSDGYKELKKHFANNPKVKFNDAKQEIWSYYNRVQFLEQLNPDLMMYLNVMHPKNIEESDAISDPFIRNFVNPHFHNKEIKSQNSLAKKSRKKVAAGFSYDKAAAKKYEEQIAGKDTKAALISLLNNNAGIIIGESHTQSHSKALFLRYLKDLKAAGVNTIYLEHIKAEYQPIIDEWYKKGHYKHPFPREVLNAAENTDKYHHLDNEKDNYNILHVIKEATSLGIRVVGIDNLAAATKSGEASSMRTIKMNILAEEIIKKDRKNRIGKYIAIVGKAHATYAENNDEAINVATLPGMSQLLNIPAVIYDKDKNIITIDTQKYLEPKNTN